MSKKIRGWLIYSGEKGSIVSIIIRLIGCLSVVVGEIEDNIGIELLITILGSVVILLGFFFYR